MILQTVSILPSAATENGLNLLLLIYRKNFCRVVCLLGVLLLAPRISAIDIAAAEQLFYSGKYRHCIEIAREEMRRNVWNDRWPRLLIQCQMAVGDYHQAQDTFEVSVRQFGYGNIALRLIGRDVYCYNNDPLAAQQQIDQIHALLANSGLRIGNNDNLVAAGRYYIEHGDDAKKVLELLYDRIRANDPNFADVYVATAELAIKKHDYKLAAETLTKAIQLRPQDPYLHYLAAQAWLPSDAVEAQQHLELALKLNPMHVPSLLLVADRLIDAEKYELAKATLTQVLMTNLAEPAAWAYHAVIAHLQGFSQAEKMFHDIALTHYQTNPHVDFLIGKKLSQHYRFRESVEYQRRALKFDAKFHEAKSQLSRDLLRLGENEEGWRMAREVSQEDGYDVVAHNLMTLENVLDGFVTLERDEIIVRMDARESRIYGGAVLNLLAEARETLAAKYKVDVDTPIAVEIFPSQKDFAIRTFGLPGGAGFLGVCFGRVITANSPASQGDTPANWQAVLWHEFCHVITLEKTHNKMPRWLSEGISVYEERQRNPTWGQALIPEYRSMMLGDELTPVSELSSAFLDAKSPLHLQFAYYESSLVVQFLIEQHGFEGLLRLLKDLGVGMPINEALTRYTGSLSELDSQFREYARNLASSFGSEANWSREKLPEKASLDEWREWAELHPDNFWGLRELSQQLIEAKEFEAAKKTLERLQSFLPEDAESNGALRSLSRVIRELGDTKAEQVVLNEVARLSADAVPEFARLAELAVKDERWDDLQTVVRRLLAVNPLSINTQQWAAMAAERLELPDEAAAALAALLEMEPIDPADLHYRLAKSLKQLGRGDDAKRQVLMALEDAPRYREALLLLLTLVEE